MLQEEITLRYDVLDLHEVYATLSYFLGHRQEMQEYLDRARQTSLVARHNQARGRSLSFGSVGRSVAITGIDVGES